ncbi:tripartite motif-containing protein 16-like protein [Triplophysa dalaica]|uniref:tripartite motif-containing protein 16-like protein n=1 Tax=Triplophysa dalaica TaxID=1582913 RepID=UPI0024DF8B02|nr:tripartite motif-containing protein 16-like protein [Triplophysa dalaica]
MAGATFSDEQFCCSVCLDLLKDPVAIPCGHSYCMSCITGCWDQDYEKGVYSCPLCRETFTPRPVLNKNTILAEIVEKLKKTKLPKEDKSPVTPGSEDVECNVCTERESKAVKSCLVCLNSYCENHLEQHEHLFRDKRHSLMDASAGLEKLICGEHDRPLEVFCRTDQLCICFMCMMEKHKNHDTERASAERTKKQRELDKKLRQFKERIQQRGKKLQELEDAVKAHKHSAQAAVDESERIFTELIHSIERSRSKVTQLIREQEKAAVSRAEGLLERLKQEIEDLKRRNDELDQLSHTDNHIHFLQNFQLLSVLPESTVLGNTTLRSHMSFDGVGLDICLLKGKIEDFCKDKIKDISCRVRDIHIITAHDPKTREEFLEYSSQLSLDPNTAHKNLCLSKSNTVVTNSGTDQQYPEHPERFTCIDQVLCRESVFGRCYWELEWSGSNDSWVGISVAYKSIDRKEDVPQCAFGFTNQSWRLSCSFSNSFRFWHENKYTDIRGTSSKIGVYVDHSAGILAFYRIADTMTLIHRVKTTFTEPLYPGFRVTRGTSVKLCYPTK